MTIDSPVGSLTLASDGTALTALRFANDPAVRDVRPDASPHDALLDDAAAQLGEYFAGARRDFDLPLRPAGTAFQMSVWKQLCAIPFGATISYGELARRVGNANASRAVGLANGRNPIAIVIPCHRVIGADGSLTGFGGGLERKRTLLKLEGMRNEGGGMKADGERDLFIPHPSALIPPLHAAGT